jgi:NADH-quinone oxidoreductase subunit N
MQTSIALLIQPLLPDIVLSLFGIAILVVDPFIAKARKPILRGLSVVAVLTAGASTFNLIGEFGTYFNGMIVVDNFSIFFRMVFLVIAGLVILSSFSYLERQNLNLSEYYALILFATVGMNMMVASSELIMIFLGLETLSVASYILLGIRRTDKKSNEAALKYFLLGSFSSAFLLYGIALLYGAAKSTNIEVISRTLETGSLDLRLVFVAAGLLFVGLGFKVAVVPFHVWTPDVYEGAPTPITAFMSAGPKAAGFAVLLRIFLTALPALQSKWLLLVWVSALLTMTVGNVVALVQSNMKRMLAYSSIAHAGYILVGFASGTEDGFAAILFYTLTYALMNIGAFTVVALIGREGERNVNIDDYAGLGFQQPFLAASLSIFLLSLAGIPLTAGFAGKFFIFRAAIESRLLWLTIFGVLNSAVSVFYYLRVIVTMYMKDPSADSSRVQVPASARVVLGLTVFGILQLGIFPGLLISLGKISVFSIH